MLESTKRSTQMSTLNSSRSPFYKDQVMFKTRVNFMKAQHNLPVQQKLSSFDSIPEPVLSQNEAHQKYIDSKIDQMFTRPERPSRGYKSQDTRAIFQSSLKKQARIIESQIDRESVQSPMSDVRVQSQCTAHHLSESSPTIVRNKREGSIKSLIQRAIKSKFMLVNA